MAKIQNIDIRLTVFLGRTYCLGFLTIFSWKFWTRVTIQFICIQIIINNAIGTDIKQIANLPVFLIPVFFLMCLFETDQTTTTPQTNHLLCFPQPGAHEVLSFSPLSPLHQHQVWPQYLSTWPATLTSSAPCSFRAWRQPWRDRDGYIHCKRCQREKGTGTACCKARQHAKY